MQFADSVDDETRHYSRSFRREVCVVFDAVRIIRILARLQLEKKFARGFCAISLEHSFTHPMHIDKRHAVFTSDPAYYVRILAVSIEEHAVVVEATAHHRSQQNRHSLLRTRFGDEANKVGSIICGRRVAIDLFFRFVVVAELN